MASPVWLTPSGFVGTFTERVTTSTSIVAEGGAISYAIISGSAPTGMSLSSTGTISGVTFSVSDTTRSQFVVRATNSSGVTDRTFYMDVVGASAPQWVTPGGFLTLGAAGQSYIISRQLVDYQFNAIYDVLPTGGSLQYSVSAGNGEVPAGLVLQKDGRLVGTILDTTSTTYTFTVTVTDSKASSDREFKIAVEPANNLRVDNAGIDVDTTIYTVDASYLVSPQWLSPANLGTVRADNKQVIQLSIYDPSPNTGPTTYDWTTPTLNFNGSPSVHPPNFNLDTATGVLYATLPYQTSYSQSYNFTVRLIKSTYGSPETTYLDKTFTLTIAGIVNNIVEFISTSSLGIVIPGYQSELYVVAHGSNADAPITYRLTSGTLPPGLSLSLSGNIVGRANYDSQTTIDVATYGFGEFTLDGGTTTIDQQYEFTVEARDVYGRGSVEQNFYLTISETDATDYTRLYVSPFLKTELRDSFNNFITDTFTFDPSLIYRKDDPAFGVQQQMKMFIEHGIEKIYINDFYDQMRQYFYRKTFCFGDVKIANAFDDAGTHVYDLVYIELIDQYRNSDNESISGPVTIGDHTVYPNSMLNMKTSLESIKIEGREIGVDSFLMPRFMRTAQLDTGNILGFVLAMPLCYAAPGKGEIIQQRIAITDFDFKLMHFDIDRLIVENNLTFSGAKYLIFPRRELMGNNQGESLSYINTTPDQGILVNEDDISVYLEL